MTQKRSATLPLTDAPEMENKAPKQAEATRYDFYFRACPSRTVLEMLADKWTLLVICKLTANPHRFGELRRAIDGVTQKMLTQTLRTLERDGLVSRTVYDTTPPSVEYALTELGQSATHLVALLRDWAQVNVPAVLEARKAYDNHAKNLPAAGVRVVSSVRRAS